MVQCCQNTPHSLSFSEVPKSEAGSRESLCGQSSIEQEIMGNTRQQQRVSADAAAQQRRKTADLVRLCSLTKTMEMTHSQPWSPLIESDHLLLMDEQAWQQYVQENLFITPVVKLPPEADVDVRALTARLTAPHEVMLPAPGRTCFCGFFPAHERCRLTLDGRRARRLQRGACIPNSVIIRILWSTRTLLDVAHYRRQENQRNLRREHWEVFEFDDNENANMTVIGLEEIATRRRNRHKLTMLDNQHIVNWIAILAEGVDEADSDDSEDEAIAREREKGVSHRGRLVHDASAASDFKQVGGTQIDISASEVSCDIPGRDAIIGECAIESRNDGDGDRSSLIASDRVSSDSGGKGSARVSATSFSDGTRSRDGPSLPPQRDGVASDRYPITPTSAKEAESVSSHNLGADLSECSADALQEAASQIFPAGYPSDDSVKTSDATEQEFPRGQHSPQHQPKSPPHSGGGQDPATSPRGGELPPHMDQLNASQIQPSKTEKREEYRSQSPPTDGEFHERHSLRMGHVVQIKDYACDDPNWRFVAEPHAIENMSYAGRRKKGSTHDHIPHDVSQRLFSQVPRQHQGRHYDPATIPGVFYDESEQRSFIYSEERSDLAKQQEQSLDRNLSLGKPHYFYHARHKSTASQSSTPTKLHDSAAPLLSKEHVMKLTLEPWILQVAPEAANQAHKPWRIADHLVQLFPDQPPAVKKSILNLIQHIFEQFPKKKLDTLLCTLVTFLHSEAEDVATFEALLNTLELLDEQMDIVVANALSVVPLASEELQGAVQSFLVRIGVVDTHRLVFKEAMTWMPKQCHRRGSEVLQKTLLRSAIYFLTTWTEMFKTHLKLIADEINKKNMAAVVKVNILKILHNYEPQCVVETPDGLDINLRQPANLDMLQNPKVSEVLNYFVEMVDHEAPEKPELEEIQVVSDSLEWRRANRDILVPPCQSPSLQGNRPLLVGLLRPTSLVTHHPSLPGLAHMPWPTIAVGIQLRIADKYYRHKPPRAAFQ